MDTLTVTVRQRKLTKESTAISFEGVYQLPHSTSAKVARKDGTSLFPTRATLSQAAKRLATSLGLELQLVNPEAVKKAAKASVKKTDKPCTGSKSCKSTKATKATKSTKASKTQDEAQ